MLNGWCYDSCNPGFRRDVDGSLLSSATRLVLAKLGCVRSFLFMLASLSACRSYSWSLYIGAYLHRCSVHYNSAIWTVAESGGSIVVANYCVCSF